MGQLRQVQQRLRRLLETVYIDDDLVFCQADGKPLHGGNVTRRDFPAVQRRVKLPRIRFHDLRHCHATHLLQAGLNLKVVQGRLGHSTAALTLSVYAHTLPGMQAEAARLVGTPAREGRLRWRVCRG